MGEADVDFLTSAMWEASMAANGDAIWSPFGGDFTANRARQLKPGANRFGGRSTYHVEAARFNNVDMQAEFPATVSAGSVQLYGTNGDVDGAGLWVPLGSALSATGTVQELAMYRYLKATLTAYAGTGNILLHLILTTR